MLLENQIHDLATKHDVEIKDEDVEKLGFKLKDKEGEEAEQEFKNHFNISNKDETEETDQPEQQEEPIEEPIGDEVEETIEESILSNKGSMITGNAKTLVQKYKDKSVTVNSLNFHSKT